MTPTLQRETVEWKAKAQVAGKCFDPQTAGIYHPAASLSTHSHKHTHTHTLGKEIPKLAGRSDLRALLPPPLGRSPGALVLDPEAGALGPPP